MYSVLKDSPDLVILDDPISSFDGNKKFAIINMLFMGKHSLKNKNVLLLTHEFNTVIDAIYNMPYNFSPTPKASFLTTKNGILKEKEITKLDIKSFGEIAHININSNMDSLNKLAYLRRLLEIQDATTEIKMKYIPDFDYNTEFQKTQDLSILKKLYQSSRSNYEKLQYY